jgi:hypothetical protein
MPYRRGRTHYRFTDLTGQSFHRWTVLRMSRLRVSGKLAWVCRCECGTIKTLRTAFLTVGLAKSCGCLQRESRFVATRTHGQSRTKEYRTWSQIVQRCCQPKNPNYPNYGGRGILLCRRWRHSFELFLLDMGPAPSVHHSINRVDNLGPYEPGNCVWATRQEQARNRRTSRLVTHGGQTRTIAEWADLTGIHSQTIRARLDVQHWPISKALTVSTTP